MRVLGLVHPHRGTLRGNVFAARTFEEALSEEGACRHFAVARAVVEEEDALFVRLGDLKDGDCVERFEN